MNSRSFYRTSIVLVVAALCGQIGPGLWAQGAAPVPASENRPVPTPAGVQEVLKLARAHVSDETIIAFVSNSTTTYHLSASEILYLREQGVSDPVIKAMLNSQQKLPEVAQPALTAPTPVAPNSDSQPAPDTAQFAPAYDVTAPGYSQPAPVYASPAPGYGYYNYSPYYWGYPGLSLGFGFGGGYYGGYRWGGYYGGGYRGGRYYGGGYHGGGYYGGGYHGGGYHGGGGGHR